MIRMVRTLSQQVPGVYRMRVGDIVVTALSDGYLEGGLEVLLNISAEEATDLLERAGRRARASINAFAIHSGGTNRAYRYRRGILGRPDGWATSGQPDGRGHSAVRD